MKQLASRLYNRARTMLFVTMVTMFALSTIYWVISVVVIFLVIRAWFSDLDPATYSPPNWLPMFNAVLLSVQAFTAMHSMVYITRLPNFFD
jgi:Gpi18-like mannosyltransferase